MKILRDFNSNNGSVINFCETLAEIDKDFKESLAKIYIQKNMKYKIIELKIELKFLVALLFFDFIHQESFIHSPPKIQKNRVYVKW